MSADGLLFTAEELGRGLACTRQNVHRQLADVPSASLAGCSNQRGETSSDNRGFFLLPAAAGEKLTVRYRPARRMTEDGNQSKQELASIRCGKFVAVSNDAFALSFQVMRVRDGVPRLCSVHGAMPVEGAPYISIPAGCRVDVSTDGALEGGEQTS